MIFHGNYKKIKFIFISLIETYYLIARSHIVGCSLTIKCLGFFTAKAQAKFCGGFSSKPKSVGIAT